MKPKKELQKKIVELSVQLPKITEKQKDWFSGSAFLKWGVVSRSKSYCLECAHAWKNGKKEKVDLKKSVCPNCGNTLKMFSENKVHFSEMEYSAILTVKEGFQIVRMVASTKHMKKNEKPQYFHSEVMQHWINENGEVTTLSKSIMGFSQCYDRWVYSSELKLKELGGRNTLRYNLNPWKIYPERKVLPILKRNGFKGRFYDIPPHHLFQFLTNNPIAETLIKANQIELFKEYYKKSTRIEKYWCSIKICIRNNYIVKNGSDWLDMLDLFPYFKRDLKNSKFICPDDLNNEHNRLVSKKRLKERRKKRHKLKEEIEESQIKYQQQKGIFFGLEFKKRNLRVKVIETVHQFMKEGDLHNHCIFENSYFEKEDSLLFTATVNDELIETVEVSLSRMVVSQSRGKGNKSTKYHTKIVELVRENLHHIRKIAIQNRPRGKGKAVA
jgi:hypothetical protein